MFDPEDLKFNTAAERADAKGYVEALARRAESEMSVMRDHQRTLKDGSVLDKDINDRVKAAKDLHDLAEKIESTPLLRDLSGVSRGLTDSAGNFANSIDVLRAGGVGIVASNTDVSKGEPAADAEHAGAALTAEEDAAFREVTIPENWEELSWNQRRTLAAQFSDVRIKNSEEADKAISAELKRREKADKEAEKERERSGGAQS